MLKGVLEGSILTIIQQKEVYGYEISQNLKSFGFGDISEGTIYPLLLRLEKNGCLNSVYSESNLGPRRKYYRLTGKGQQELMDFQINFEEMVKAVYRLLEMKKIERCGEDESENENIIKGK
jgi:Predicted transcriptional regulators